MVHAAPSGRSTGELAAPDLDAGDGDAGVTTTFDGRSGDHRLQATMWPGPSRSPGEAPESGEEHFSAGAGNSAPEPSGNRRTIAAAARA